MGSVQSDIFICLDCESTGLDPEQDRIIEIAITRFDFARTYESFETLIDPERDIPEVSQEIHKISREMLKGKPKIKEILPQILAMIDGYVVVGHAIEFDLSLIAAEARRCGMATKMDKQAFVDTLRLARIYGESPTNSLEQLRRHFNIPAEGAHRAMSDVLVNIEVFKFLSKPYKTTEEILQTLRKPIKLKTMPLGKHKGRRFEEIPLEYLQWAEKKDFDQDLLHSIRSEIKQRRRGGGFGQAANPFGDL